MRYKNIRKVAIENKSKKVAVRFPSVGDKELGVKIIKKSEYENLVEMRKLKARTSAQVMAKVEKIDHYMIGEIVKKHTHQMIGELIDSCFINTQWIEKLKSMISDGIDMTMAKMKMTYAIEESIKRHKQYAKIAAGLDFDELGPVIKGKVTRENWLRFMGQTLSSCMPGANKNDLIDPFTGLSDEEQAELDEMAREAWEESCEEDARNWSQEDYSDLAPDFGNADENDDNEIEDIPF